MWEHRVVCKFLVVLVVASAGFGATGCRNGSPGASPPETDMVVAALNASPKTSDFVIEASNSVRLQTGGLIVNGGDIGARGTGSGPFLGDGVAVDALTGVQVQTTRTIIAGTVNLETGSTVGDIEATHVIVGTGAKHGTLAGLVPLPAIPTAAAVSAGTTNVTVATGATVSVSPGHFGAINVGTGSTLKMAAGAYDMSSLTMASGAKIQALGAVQLRVAGRLSTSSGASIGPAAGVTLTAGGIRIEVSGQNGTTGALNATPAAASFGTGNYVAALVLVPNGTLVFGTGATATGAFMGRDVDLGGAGAKITYQDGFPSGGATCTAQSCDDGNPCTTDSCGANGVCTHAAAASGTSCSDGNACNGAETCDGSGVCKAGTPVACVAQDQCHVAGTCNATTGLCSNPLAANGTACNDGSACTQTDTCQSGICTGSNPVACAAPDQCHAAGTCNPTTGVCSNPTVANGTACNDGNACTQTDSCQSGVCTGGSPVSCPAPDQCHTAGLCNPTTGACSSPTAANGTPCNDGNACTQTDSCQVGICVGGNPVTCAASDQCHSTGTCNPLNGICSNPVASNGTVCNDSNACTRTDSCQGGLCTGGNPVTCTPSDQCHSVGTCNPSSGICSNPIAVNGTACSDGNACTASDTCQAGTCMGGSPITCLAQDQCHSPGTCNPSTGACSNPVAADGTACDDKNLCTTGDSCRAGACLGSPKICTATDSCHDQGTCDPTSGTCSNPPRPCATNHPPRIISQPVTGFDRTTASGPNEPVNVRAWTPVQYQFFDQGPASWQIDSSGTVATQVLNSDASALISDIVLTNDHIEGTWQVAVGDDDDFVGFVFGWQDQDHFYLFDWKEADQNDPIGGFAERGMTVKVVSVDSDLRENDLWPTAGNGSRVRPIFHNVIPWQHFVPYNFALDFRSGNFTITVTQGTTVLATIDLNDSTYTSGRFGFYNDSQDGATYSSFFHQALPTPQYQYNVVAVDPDGDPLVYSLLTAPPGMTIDPHTGQITWTTTDADVGSHDVTVQVRDPSGLTDTQRYSVSVAINNPPVVDAGPDQQALGVSFPGVVELPGSVHDELPVGDPRLQIQWSVVSGPGAVSFSDPSSPTTEAIFFQPGTYVLQLSAFDSLSTANDFVTVAVDTEPSLDGASFLLTSSSPGPLQTGNTLALTATLLDATSQPIVGFPVQFQISGANPQNATVPTDSSGHAQFSYTGTNVGTDTLQAVALGVASSSNATLPSVVWGPGGGGGQTTPGWIGSPAQQATVSGSVPITVGAGVTVVSGSIDYWPELQPADVHTLAATVSGGPGATLATLDTTLLMNGPWVIRLTATDSLGDQQTSFVALTLTGDYKPGRMTLSVTDFTVPLVGLPITVGRTYDSLQRDRVGDFGNGWALSIGNPAVEVDPAYNVTLTEPSGRRVTFFFTLTSYPFPLEFLFKPSYTPEPGVFGTLTADGCPLLEPVGTGVECFLEGSPVYTPSTYTYTDPYGRVFTMASTGQLSSIQDINGNKITLGADGITSSAGGVNVPFVRDAQGRITSITDPSGNVYTYEYAGGDLTAVGTPGGRFTYSYDGGHLLLHASDPNGHSPVTTTYDGQGRLATTVDAVGNVTSYAYDLTGRTTTTTNPDHGIDTQLFDDRGLLVSETDPLGRTTTSIFDANLLKTSQTNPAGETTHWTYDGAGRRTSQTDAAGRVTLTTYTDSGLVSSRTDATGNTTVIAYDDNLSPKSFADGVGGIATFASSQQGVPLTATDANGATASYVYDAHGNLTSRTDRLGRVTTSVFDDMGRETLRTDPRGGQTRTTYTPLGNVATQQDAGGATTTNTYDGLGNRLTESRPGTAALKRYGYDAANRVTTVLNFDGTTRTSSYDFRGNRLLETDELGRATRYDYDLGGQLIKTTRPDGTFVGEAYDALGRLVARTDERGGVTSYTYETGCGCSDRVTSVSDPLGHLTSMTYDPVGRLVTKTNPAGRTTSFTYDPRGRLLKTTYADGSSDSNSYDGVGRRTSHTDQTGALTNYAYDAEGELTEVADTLGGITLYDYDASGNLTSVSDANEHRTSYDYDLLNRKTQRTLPLQMSETFGYDLVGNTISHRDFRGKTTTLTYDLRDRLLSRTPDPILGEPTVAFAYNDSSTRATMTDASGVTSYSYDARDRLVSKITPAGTLTYSYDQSGNVASVESSNANGTSLAYAWDGANQLLSVTDNRLGRVTTASYTATGRPAGLAQPTGVAATYSYDSLDRVISLVWQKGSPPALASWAYTYNARGQRLTSVDVTGRQATYGYDAGSRLLSESVTGDPSGPAGNGLLGYVLDGAGNRLSRTSTLAAVAAQSFDYDANDQLTRDGYDLNGNSISSQGHSYSYDFADRLTSKDSGAVTVVYDGDGHRVAKTAGGLTTQYLVDDLNPTGHVQVLEEISGATVQTRYTYGERIISQTQQAGSAPATHFYGYDAHGNIAFLTDTSGSVTDTYVYDAWGNLVASTGTTANTRLFAGEERDPDLSLINLRGRQYRADDGRFLTIDPLELPSRARPIALIGAPPADPYAAALFRLLLPEHPPIDPIFFEPIAFNRYLYAVDDPVDMSDPTGWEAEEEGEEIAPAEAEIEVEERLGVKVMSELECTERYASDCAACVALTGPGLTAICLAGAKAEWIACLAKATIEN